MEILELLSQKKYSQVKSLLLEQNQVDIAGELEKIDDEETLVKCFRLLKKDMAAEVFAYLSTNAQKKIIEQISEKELGQITEELFLDDTVDLIESMPANVVKRILSSAKPEKRTEINKFLGYEEKSSGSIMTPEYLDLKEDMTVYSAFKRIKKQASDKETINYCYVVDNSRVLKGIVSIRDLIMADEDEKIKDIMETNIIFVKTDTDQEEASNIFKKYDMSALPVVDIDNRMVGIITIDDIIDIIEEENTEDFEKMAAMTPSSETYLKTSVFQHTKKRVVWLTLLMISAIFTGMLLTNFEGALSKEIVLVAFLPMLMDTTGNCGSQASTLMIRGLALNEIRFKDYFKIFFKEFRISLLIGSFIATFNFFRVWIQYGRIELACVIAISLLLVVIIANFIGFTMPLLAKKLKLDPAVMAAPIITTILDCCVVLIYFSVASSILGI